MILPAVAIGIREGCFVHAWLLEDVAQPVHATSRQVADQRPHRPPLGRWLQRQLVRCEAWQAGNKVVLDLRPAFVDRRHAHASVILRLMAAASSPSSTGLTR